MMERTWGYTVPCFVLWPHHINTLRPLCRRYFHNHSNLGIRRNFLLKNSCGVNVKGNIKTLLKEQRNIYNNLLNSTRKDYIKNKIENVQSSKDLYKICDKLLNREQRSVLPSHDCATSLANTFVDYFKNKIELIRSNFEESLNTSTDQLPSTAPIFHGLSLEQFRVVSESDVRKVITSSSTKYCALDPIPTWLLKQCLDQVAPVLTVIVNTSLSCADFTPELKRAFVTHLIKN